MLEAVSVSTPMLGPFMPRTYEMRLAAMHPDRPVGPHPRHSSGTSTNANSKAWLPAYTLPWELMSFFLL